MPAIFSGGKVIGREALSSVADIAKDVIAGKNFQSANEDRFSSAIDTLKES